MKKATQFPSGNSIPIEIIVSDGGPTDETKKIASKLADLVIESPLGRSIQSNLVGEAARSDTSYFFTQM